MKKLLTLLIVLFVTPYIYGQTQPTDTDGDGYYNISTLDELRWISENSSSWSWNFELDNDIDAGDTQNWNFGDHDNNPATPDEAMGWSPIGNSTTKFIGNFEGHGHKISNLNINRSSIGNVGFWGFTNESSIENINIHNCNISGQGNVGVIVGCAYNTDIDNSTTSGTVSGSGNNIGGLVGYNYNYSDVTNSVSSVNITASGDYTGGLVGNNYLYSSITDSYATGTVAGVNYVGGLVGYNQSYSKIEDSYATGDVTGTAIIGGMVGKNTTTISYSYATGSVTSTGGTTGGFVGHNDWGVISHSHSIGDVTSDGNQVGGFVGTNEDEKISNCYSEGNVSGSFNVGGFSGYLKKGTISDCYATGNVSGTGESIGGLIGYCTCVNVSRYYRFYVYNCYAKGNVTGANYVGGLVGYTVDYGSSPISGCYSIGSVTGTGSVIGGFIGRNTAGVSKGYWKEDGNLDDTGSNGNIDGINERTADEMKIDTTYSDWDFTNKWSILGIFNDGYPILKNNYIETVPEKPTDSDDDGYYNISTLNHLRWISENESSWKWNFELDNDIDASDTRNWNADGSGGFYGWEPLGYHSVSKFEGLIDGQGFEISNLYINSGRYTGLIGYAENAMIIDLGLTDCEINGELNTGAFFGGCASCALYGCYSSGSIYGKGSVGGLIGNSSYTEIKDSYSTASVSMTDTRGGGVSGYIYRSKIENTYFAGTVSGNVGAFLGYDSDNTMTNCFWDTETTGKTTGIGMAAGELEGKTSAELKTEATYTSANWDFTNIWNISVTENNGYPTLDDTLIEFSGIEPTDTDEDGYKNISLFSHLQWISNNKSSWTDSYELDNDIDADSSLLIHVNSGFRPIGNSSYFPFIGEFNGNGFKIKNMYIRANSNCGLIGYAVNSRIKELGMSEFNIYGNGNCTGGLIGFADTTVITRCFTKGDIIGRRYTGSLAGNLHKSTVKECFTDGSVTSDAHTGGILGYVENSDVSNCFSKVDVTGHSWNAGWYNGGFIGYSRSNNINNCYSIGIVTGYDYTGGFAGGKQYGSINDCFWDKETSGLTTSYAGTGKTTAEMNSKSTFENAGWDFNDTWAHHQDLNSGYPYLQKTIEDVYAVEPTDTDEDGLVNISLLAHLRWVAENSESWTWSFELDNNINAVDTKNWNDNEGWLPIGQSYYSGNIDSAFTGTFDGQGFVIDSLYMNRYGADRIYLGFFGTTNSTSKIMNLGITNCTIIANSYNQAYAGCLIGCNLTGAIVQNCHSSGSVSADCDYKYTGDSFAGGIVGSNGGEIIGCNSTTTTYASGTYSSSRGANTDSYAGGIAGNNGGLIKNCYASGNAKAQANRSRAGGLTGGNSGTIEQCYATGNVDAPAYSSGYGGGLTGYNSANITNCYARGDVYAYSYSGGLIGSNYYTASVKRCYSIGIITTNRYRGGLIGSSSGTITDCFWDIETSNLSSSNGGVGKTTAEMKIDTTYTDWAFGKVWEIDPNKNDGYPSLLMLPSQIIHLNQGWNLISSNLVPNNDEIESVLNDLGDKFLICRGEGSNIYFPKLNLNSINNWDYKKAYRVYMNEPADLEVAGNPIADNATISLEQGWNTLAFMMQEETDITVALAGIANDLLIVRDGNGKIYFPFLNLNQIITLKPGEGYLIYMKNPAVLDYP
jgi:hypothetical protein